MAMSSGKVNATELTAALINQKDDLVSGILHAQEMIQDRSQAICTEEDLRHYADNLLRGDH